MIVAEDFEDIEHRRACIFLVRPLVANNREEAVERRFELRPRGERLGELDTQLIVVRVGRELSLEIREVMAARCLETGGRLEPVDFCVRHKTAEHNERFLGLAAIDEE